MKGFISNLISTALVVPLIYIVYYTGDSWYRNLAVFAIPSMMVLMTGLLFLIIIILLTQDIKEGSIKETNRLNASFRMLMLLGYTGFYLAQGSYVWGCMQLVLLVTSVIYLVVAHAAREVEKEKKCA